LRRTRQQTVSLFDVLSTRLVFYLALADLPLYLPRPTTMESLPRAGGLRPAQPICGKRRGPPL